MSLLCQAGSRLAWNSGFEVAGLRHGAATSLDAVCRSPVTTTHHCLKVLAKNLLSQEASNESIPGSICVYNLLLWNGSHREGVKFSMLDGNDRVASLSDHHKSAAAAVLLGQLSNFHCNLANVGGVQLKALSIGGSLSLIAENNVSEWQH